MSIATAIQNLQAKISNAYTAIENKGGALPATQNAENLSATIDAIPSGGSSSKFGATIDDVFSTEPVGTEVALDLWGGVSELNFTGVTSIANKGLAYAFNERGITQVAFPNLKTVGSNGFSNAFFNCTGLLSVSFPNLVSADSSAFQYAFRGCTNLSSVSFPELTTLTTPGNQTGHFAHTFDACTKLQVVEFPKLSAVPNGAGTSFSSFSSAFTGMKITSLSFPELLSAGDWAFYQLFGATSNNTLSSVSFPKLHSIGNAFNNAFRGIQNLLSASFPALESIVTNQSSDRNAVFYTNTYLTRLDFPVLTTIKKTESATSNDLLYLFNGCTNLVEIHFGAANQSVIEGSAGYATKWGAPNAGCQIYFDL